MKKKIAIFFGGKSGEHEVSIHSALNIFYALDKEKYEGVLIGIDKKGNFRYVFKEELIENPSSPKNVSISANAPIVQPIKEEDGKLLFFYKENGALAVDADFVFPIVHGNLGEDGSLQGFLRIVDIPFAGASVLGSAIGMDKDVTKRLLTEKGIPVCRFFTIYKEEFEEKRIFEIGKMLNYPLFVKPCNAGSSLGISKVKSEREIMDAVKRAFQFDKKVIFEEAIVGRELECSVLGNENIEVSCFGEIIPKHEFYSYVAKYVDEYGAELIAPAKLDKEIEDKMKDLAKKSFRILECEGMARVDFFLSRNGEIYLNEINTLPGFTKISMYPKLWELSGISYKELLNRLIELGFRRYENEKKLKISAEF